MAQSENPRLEELLCNAIQHEVDGQARLVHPTTADEVVREEAPTKSLARFRVRS
ncbi:hypothetical protein D3C71_1828060 [compost metagenome]